MARHDSESMAGQRDSSLAIGALRLSPAASVPRPARLSAARGLPPAAWACFLARKKDEGEAEKRLFQRLQAAGAAFVTAGRLVAPTSFSGLALPKKPACKKHAHAAGGSVAISDLAGRRRRAARVPGSFDSGSWRAI